MSVGWTLKENKLKDSSYGILPGEYGADATVILHHQLVDRYDAQSCVFDVWIAKRPDRLSAVQQPERKQAAASSIGCFSYRRIGARIVQAEAKECSIQPRLKNI